VNSKSKSLYNTPPTYPLYVAGLVFDWALKQGGLKALADLSREKSDLIYGELERFPETYKILIEKPFRSRTNIVFRLVDESQESVFVEEAKKQQMVGLNGHRSVGGIRVSLYNATGLESTKKLAAFIAAFASKK
jgi:phosphoserine aminotransferase